jgi:hypothetical protein
VERIRLDQDAIEIQAAEQLFQRRTLTVSGDIENWTRGDTKTGPPRSGQRTTD